MDCRNRWNLVFSLSLVLLAPAAALAQGDEIGEDVLIQALVDEMNRSARMQLADLQSPYFVQYLVDDTRTDRVAVTCGAVTASQSDHTRRLSADVRVGSYELDSSNGGGGRRGFGGRMGRGRRPGMPGGGSGTTLPIDDDYTAIRHAIWRVTDGLYKSAVESLAAKQVMVEQQADQERPPDFSHAEPIVHVEPEVGMEIDRGAWEERLREASRVFLDHPEIIDSSIALSATAGNRTIVNTEGTRLQTGQHRITLTISARAQADDGSAISGRREITVEAPQDLPDAGGLHGLVDALATELVASTRAPVLEDYTGPVLFDGFASPQMFRRLLASGLVAQRNAAGSGRRRFSRGENLEKYLGRRILPRDFRVYDDPRQVSAAGQLLAGHYLFDDDAVAAQRVDLVVAGKLREMLVGRVPAGPYTASNGHGRGRGSGGIGCLFIKSENAVGAGELRDALIEAARDQGLEYGIRVSAIQAGGSPMARAMNFGAGRGRGGRGMIQGFGAMAGAGLGDPSPAYKVYLDGHEEPVRGCEFGELDVGILKDIVAAGSDLFVDNSGGGSGSGSSVIAPAVLLEEVDLYRIEDRSLVRPALEAPHARG